MDETTSLETTDSSALQLFIFDSFLLYKYKTTPKLKAWSFACYIRLLFLFRLIIFSEPKNP